MTGDTYSGRSIPLRQHEKGYLQKLASTVGAKTNCSLDQTPRKLFGHDLKPNLARIAIADWETQVRWYDIRTHIRVRDETYSDYQGKDTHEGRCDIVQPPGPKTTRGHACDQRVSSDGAGQRRVSNGECNASSCSGIRRILVVFRVNFCQNGPHAQHNSKIRYVINLSLSLSLLARRREAEAES